MTLMVPKWQDDSAASKCYLCKTRFTFFNRRHHCRKCGQLVCATCSAKKVRYFSNSYVLNTQGTPQRARSHTYYRTCDVCVDEITMIRNTLLEATSLEDHVLLPENNSPIEEPTPAVDLVPHALDSHPGVRSDAASDADMCPVCGIDLRQQYATDLAGGPIELEPYKEAHVSQCLTTFDFTNDNLRLSSPPGGPHARNRMLVYNMPPIPQPSYETIAGNSPNSTSTLAHEGERGDGGEKDAMDVECVICLEDLCPGDKVGRLECLCVFHYKCIKDWFNKKSFAECPVHFLHS